MSNISDLITSLVKKDPLSYNAEEKSNLHAHVADLKLVRDALMTLWDMQYYQRVFKHKETILGVVTALMFKHFSIWYPFKKQPFYDVVSF